MCIRLRRPCVKLTSMHAAFIMMCATDGAAAVIQYLCQMSWTSWCDAKLLEIHYDLLHLVSEMVIKEKKVAIIILLYYYYYILSKWT